MVLTQKDRKLRPITRSAQRPVRDHQRTKENCSIEKFTTNFLKHQFPILVASPEALYFQQQLERDFFFGLKEFCKQYDYIPPNIINVGYPYNLHYVIHDANEFLSRKKLGKRLRFLRLADGKESLCLLSAYDTESTLYYLALEPLWQIRRSVTHKQEAALMTSILAYFYQVLQIPSYTKGDSVDMYYSMIKDDLRECKCEYEPEDYKANLNEIRMARNAGKQMCTVLNNPVHIKHWEKRMSAYVADHELAASILKLSACCFRLYQQYPDYRFNRNFCPEFFRQNADFFLYADQFISFVWSYEGWLFNGLQDFVYNDTSNCDSMDEPLLIKAFDTEGGREISDGKFEADLFEAMNQLAQVLEDINEHFKTQKPDKS